MTPGRATAAVAALCAIAIAIALGSTRAAQRRLPPDTLLPPAAFPPLRLARVDAHVHFAASSVDAAVRLAEANGIASLVNVSGGSPGGDLEAQLAAARPYGARLAVLMELDLDGCCSDAWARREAARVATGKALGARGLAVADALGLTVQDAARMAAGASPLDARVPLDAPVLDPVWRACAELGMPVLLHARAPRAFFDAPGAGAEAYEDLGLDPERSLADRARFPPWQQLLDERMRLVERHRGATFVGAAFAGDAEDPAAVARLMDRLPNLWVDTAGRVGELGRHADASRAAILAHPDRVLFGTELRIVEGPDWKGAVYAAGQPYILEGSSGRGAAMARFFDGNLRFFETRDRAIPSPAPTEGDRTIDGIGLPRAALVALYRTNAERLFGVRAPPVEER